MRTDVKLGLLISFVVVVMAGWYFQSDPEDSAATIPIQDAESSLTLASPRASQPRTATGEEMDAGTEGRGDEGANSSLERERRVRPPSTAIEKPTMAKEEVSSIIQNMLAVRVDEASGDDAPVDVDEDRVGPVPPRASVATATTSRLETHTIRAGDTIIAIARIYFGNTRYVQAILDANPQIADSTSLTVGSIINIPEGGSEGLSPGREPATIDPVENQHAVTPLIGAPAHDGRPRRPSPPKRSVPGQRTYTVAAGDTLYRIALNQLGESSRWTEIQALNKVLIGDDPGALAVGQVLKLPN